MALVWIGALTVVGLLITVWHPLDLIGNSPEILYLGECLNPCGHVCSFALLAALPLTSRWKFRRAVAFGVLPTLAMASELVQFYLPRHTPEIGDVLLDLLGIAIGVAIAKGWSLFRGFNRQRARLRIQEGFRFHPAGTRGAQ